MNLTRLDIERDLEELVAKLLQSALKLPHGAEGQKILEQISGFRVRINLLKAKTNLTPPQTVMNN